MSSTATASPAQQDPFVATLLAGRKSAKYKAGSLIFSQGDACSDIHFVEEGVVKLTLVSKRGKGAVVGIVGKGEFFGEACIAGHANHQTSAVALVPCSIVSIKRKTMLRLIEEQRIVSSHFIESLLARNQRMEQALIDHLFNSSEKRLARTLLLLAQYGNDNRIPSVLDRISQDTLADMVGTTRSRVNFFMNKFRKLGYIHYNGGLKVHQSLLNILHD